MIDTHRSQIAGSDGGSVGSVLGRHKKVKQSVGDSVKLAGIGNNAINAITGAVHGVTEATLGPVGHIVAATEPKSAWTLPGMRAKAIGAAVGSAGIPIGAYALGRHSGKNKKAMLPNQPPPDPQIQQEWRGRPKKMKDTANVAGAMDHVSTMLAPASTTAGSG